MGIGEPVEIIDVELSPEEAPEPDRELVRIGGACSWEMPLADTRARMPKEEG
jgi:hypothetical protein